jgi:hypothetical protein
MHWRTYEHRHAESILNANHRLKKEIERTLARLDLDRPPAYGRPDPRDASRPHRRIQQAFVRHGWKSEVLVSPRTAKRHFFDLYKDRVAIEIELSNRELLYRDYIRFLLAETDGRLDVGVILLLDDDARYLHPCGLRNGLPRLEDVRDDLTSLHSVIGVPIWVVALS